MLSRQEYIQSSLIYNLFWLRIMKEHAVFLEASMPPPAKQFAAQAEQFRQQYDRLLASAIRLSNGVIPREALQSGQYHTRYTEEAERLTQKDTGIAIRSDLTRASYQIEPYSAPASMTASLEREVTALNQSILDQTNAFARFKATVLNNQSACRLFSLMYTANMTHVLHEAEEYIKILDMLKSRDGNLPENYKTFWIKHMAEHAMSMRGLLDPTERELIAAANQFAQTFEALAQSGMEQNREVAAETEAISIFKADTTRGLIECKVQAIMLPLFVDHLLREAYHFLYLLRF